MMERGEEIIKKIEGRMYGLRGRIKKDKGMEKIKWFREGGKEKVMLKK